MTAGSSAGMEATMREVNPEKPWATWLAELERAWRMSWDDERYGDAIGMLVRAGKARGVTWVADRLDWRTQAHYVAAVLDGMSPLLAEMFAWQKPPMSNTDREFLEGHCNGSQWEGQEVVGDAYAAVAREAGVDPKGKVYLSGLARFPGDPEAWVDGRGDVQRICEKRGWACEGSVNVKHRDVGNAPVEDVDVADDIVEQRILEKVWDNPELAAMDKGELFHQAKEEIRPHWTTPNVPTPYDCLG